MKLYGIVLDNQGLYRSQDVIAVLIKEGIKISSYKISDKVVLGKICRFRTIRILFIK